MSIPELMVLGGVSLMIGAAVHIWMERFRRIDRQLALMDAAIEDVKAVLASIRADIKR